jgi:hypothetical protein
MRYFLYLIHEVPVERPYYCKVGFTHSPLKRLAQLQAGNPRPLRSIDYSRRPTGDFGFPVPSKPHACALEDRMFERFSKEGIILHGDFDYDTLKANRREWVSGLHPDVLWKVMLEEWHAYVEHYGIWPVAK